MSGDASYSRGAKSSCRSSRHGGHRGRSFAYGPARRVRGRALRSIRPAVAARRGTRAQGAPRRHPHGGAAAAARGAAQRLPDHAGGPGAQRRRLAPEPRLGLPGAGAARGRGPDPLGGGRRAQAVRDHRRRSRARSRSEAPSDRRRGSRWATSAVGEAQELGRLMREVASRVRPGDAHGQRGPDRQGPRGARGHAPRSLPDPRRRRHRRRRRKHADAARANGDADAGTVHRDSEPDASTRQPNLRATAPSAAVSVNGLVKRYDEVEAVRGIDFEVATGEIFGFLGPNGAGKSTTINMLCTLVRPSGGSALVAGHDVVAERDDVRRNIGLVFQDTTLDGYLTRRAEPAAARRALRRAARDRCASACAR